MGHAMPRHAETQTCQAEREGHKVSTVAQSTGGAVGREAGRGDGDRFNGLCGLQGFGCACRPRAARQRIQRSSVAACMEVTS